MAYRNYTLAIEQAGTIIPNVSGTLKLDETNGRAVLDLGASTLAQLLASAGIVAADIAAGIITKTKLAGGFARISVVDGEDESTTHKITVTGMAAGDEPLAVLVLTTKADVATLAAHAGTLTAAEDAITPGTEVDNTGNQYIVFWNDLT